jgi:prevent-host-death family protein
MAWQLQEAKNKLSKVVREAQSEPQVIMVRGEEKAVVVSAVRYRELTAPKSSLLEFMQASPWAEVDLELERSKDMGRDVEL